MNEREKIVFDIINTNLRIGMKYYSISWQEKISKQIVDELMKTKSIRRST